MGDSKKCPIAYIFKKPNHNEDFKDLRDNNEVHFLSDETDLRLWIGGIEYRGVVFSGDARLSRDNLEYLMTRFRCRDERGYLYLWDDYHRDMAHKIFEQHAIYYLGSPDEKEEIEHMINAGNNFQLDLSYLRGIIE